MSAEVTFDRVQHLVRVPVQLAGETYQFLVDTGVGVTVVSSAIAARSDVQPLGETYAAQRMSGQTVEVPLVRLPMLDLGGHRADGHTACVADLGDPEGPNGFSGIVGLDFFEDHVITTDARAMKLLVRRAADFAESGFEIPVEVRRDGPAVDSFTRLVLPSGREVVVEVDTGSHNLILDTRFMADCGLGVDDPAVDTKTGTDETGYRWTRRWATARGSIHLAAAPQTAQADPRVQFQDIIYDGLLGSEYLERYLLHFDVPGARIVLSEWPR